MIALILMFFGFVSYNKDTLNKSTTITLTII